MAVLEGLQKLLDTLKAKAARATADAKVQVAVGYSADYALQVHEDLQAFHKNGQAKYLERPARELAPDLAAQVSRDMKAGKSMAEALTGAGKTLLEASQAIVPVNTGFLLDSGFVETASD